MHRTVILLIECQTFVSGYQETANKEKFLVAAFQTDLSQEQFSPEKISEIWKSAAKDQLFEYR